jgi:hypothetical protein
LRGRRNQLLPGLIQDAANVTDLDNGLRLDFANAPDLLARLLRVIEQEQVCCSFLRFQVTAEPQQGPVVLEVTGPAGTREMLRSL